MTATKTGNGEIRQIVLKALEQQTPIDRETLADHVAAHLNMQRDSTFNRAFGVSLSWMCRDGEIRDDDEGVHLNRKPGNNPTVQQERREAQFRRIVQANGSGDRVQLSPFLLQRDPRVVTLESSPVYWDDVVKVEFQIGGGWFEIDSEGGLRICVGDEKPAWSPNEQTNTGVRGIRLTLRNGQIIEYGHNPDAPITTLRRTE
jgi:hypothetical protein